MAHSLLLIESNISSEHFLFVHVPVLEQLKFVQMHLTNRRPSRLRDGYFGLHEPFKAGALTN